MTAPVYLHGLGAAGGFGTGRQALAAALAGGPLVPDVGTCTPTGGTTPAYSADLAPLAGFVDRRALRRLDRFSQLAALGAHLALADAGLEGADLCDLGLVVATGYGPATTTMRFLDSAFDDGDACASPTRFSRAVHNAAAAALSMRLGIKGPSATVSQFEMSVFGALLAARQLLLERRADLVLCGAVESWCALIGHCYRRYFGEPDGGPPRPFAYDQQSAVPGEATAFVVLGREAPERSAVIAIDAVRSGAGSAEAVREQSEPGRWFLGADGHRACGGTYPAVLPPAAPLAACAPLWGSFPTAPALDLAAAIVHLEGQPLAPALTAGPDNPLPHRATCLKLKGEDEYGLIGLHASGGSDA